MVGAPREAARGEEERVYVCGGHGLFLYTKTKLYSLRPSDFYTLSFSDVSFNSIHFKTFLK